MWARRSVEDGVTWITRFSAKTKPAIHPDVAVTFQAVLTAAEGVYLVSDNPLTTFSPNDMTAVDVDPDPASVTGVVLENGSGLPLAASLTIEGTITRNATTDEDGAYAFSSLPPGDFTLRVEADHHEYASPAGPVDIVLAGLGEMRQVDFHLRHADTLPPRSILEIPAAAIVQDQRSVIAGWAEDALPGTGVAKVEVAVGRLEDGRTWTCNGWQPGVHWLAAAGSDAWKVELGTIVWDPDTTYSIASRATDGAGNAETPIPEIARFLVAPTLLSPGHGATVGSDLTFAWSAAAGCLYRIQVAPTDDFENVTIDRTVAVRSSPAEGMPAGSYYWRVRALRAGIIDPGDPDPEHPATGAYVQESDWSPVWAFRMPEGRSFARGDFNGDGKADISDAVAALSYLFLGAPVSSCLESADANNDGKLDITDAVFELSWLFLGGRPLPPPGPPPACDADAPDPESGSTVFLGCEDYPPCR
jgi:hypothetical protein